MLIAADRDDTTDEAIERVRAVLARVAKMLDLSRLASDNKAASRRKADRRSGERRERRRAPGDLGEQRGGDATARSAGHERHERVDLGAERSEDADGDHGKSHAVR